MSFSERLQFIHMVMVRRATIFGNCDDASSCQYATRTIVIRKSTSDSSPCWCAPYIIDYNKVPTMNLHKLNMCGWSCRKFNRHTKFVESKIVTKRYAPYLLSLRKCLIVLISCCSSHASLLPNSWQLYWHSIFLNSFFMSGFCDTDTKAL